MKSASKLAVLTAFVLFATGLNAQTADDIITKHIEAIGGKEKLAAINSVRLENSLEIMGNAAPSTTIIQNGKGYRMDSEFMGNKIVQSITDKGGWAINPMGGSAEPEPMPAEMYKSVSSLIYIVPLLDHQAKGYKAELIGKEKIGENEAWKLKVNDKDGIATTYYFDAKTYYNIQMEKEGEMMGNTVTNIVTYSDFRKTDAGWVVPFSQETNLGGQFTLTSKLSKIEFNIPIDPVLFEAKK